MKTKINGKKALKLLRKAVKERGEDYTYESPEGEEACKYQVDGKPSCGIGLALTYLGVSEGALVSLDEVQTTPELAYFATVLGSENIELTPKARLIFQTFQEQQDAGVYWGDAYDTAKREANHAD